MKKIRLLSGMIMLGVVASVKAIKLPKQRKEQLSIEEVQRKKLTRQQELARKPVYKMVDPLIEDINNIDWPSVFHILRSMKGVINVNEYRTPDNESLLDLAALNNSPKATKILLEDYKANPNPAIGDCTPLMIACAYGHIPVIKELLKSGADAYMLNPEGRSSVDAAINNGQPEALKVIAEHYNHPELLNLIPLAEDYKKNPPHDYIKI